MSAGENINAFARHAVRRTVAAKEPADGANRPTRGRQAGTQRRAMRQQARYGGRQWQRRRSGARRRAASARRKKYALPAACRRCSAHALPCITALIICRFACRKRPSPRPASPDMPSQDSEEARCIPVRRHPNVGMSSSLQRREQRAFERSTGQEWR